MNLKDLAKTPQLIKITLNDEELLKEFGEALDFYTYDRQPMDTFLKIASTGGADMAELGGLLKDMILDSEGQAIIKDGMMLPTRVLMAAFTELVTVLGK